MKTDKIEIKTIFRILADIFMEVIISVVLLGLGALLVPTLYHIFTTADRWIVITLVVVICAGLSLYMAKVFE